MAIHISKTCNSAFYYLYNLRRIRKFLSEDNTKTLIHAFISSRDDYSTVPYLVIRMLSPRQLSVNGPFCLLHLSYGMLCQDLLGNPFQLTLLRES
ncbi:unnamed protein product [Porites evermanni]|uniref:Uncharacterized protein n=1 Tax=Porites evermanni TaxID=104178 RepID=A0ABN8MBX0_9CNID|nr:unnamed protein product [Porites evermanni]